MSEKDLCKDYTTAGLPLQLESIQGKCEPGRAPIVGEVLEKQRKIHEALGIPPPQWQASIVVRWDPGDEEAFSSFADPTTA